MSEILQSQEIELSNGEYRYPFPDDTEVSETQEDIESHQGLYRGAVDFLVPEGTLILAARGGIVINVIDEHSKHGQTKEFERFLNYITIRHDDGERSQYCHLGKDTARVDEGDKVEGGQPIGVVGWSGRTDALHIHFFVFRPASDGRGFRGLKPRFKGELKIKGIA